VVHVGKYYHGVLSKVMGGAGVMRHLGDGDVSEDTVMSHFFYEGVRSSDILLVVGGSDMSELCPYPVSGRDDGLNLQMFQEDMLELNYLFMGDVSCRGEVEVSVPLLVALLVKLGDPPAANQNDGMLGQLFDLCAGGQDKKSR
jgi:hypothetical protein